MKTYDYTLKVALAKMLPGVVECIPSIEEDPEAAPALCWTSAWLIDDAELLHLCHLIETALTDDEYRQFHYLLAKGNNRECEKCCRCFSASWQKRVIALAATKGVEVQA